MRRARPTLTTVGLTLAVGAIVILAMGATTRAASTSAAPGNDALVQLRGDDPISALTVGSILVASKRVGDPTFARSVIVLFAHSEDGAGGLIVNRLTTMPIARVLPDLPVPRSVPSMLFLGGPVAVQEMRALLRGPVGPDGARSLIPGVHLLVNREAVDAAASEGISADRLRVYAGYAGWAGGQLESEIRRGDWHVFDGDDDVVFDIDPDTLWERQIRMTEALAV